MAGEKYKIAGFGLCRGGLVESIIRDGGFAVGVEGSDYPKYQNLYSWSRLKDNLFTADITEPFMVADGDQILKFNIITAWEVLEHIKEENLDKVMENIRHHLDKNGIVIFSISAKEEVIGDVRLHQNVKPKEWWLERFEELGFVPQEVIKKYFGRDFVRGETYLPDQYSFNVALTKIGEEVPNKKRLAFLHKISLVFTPLEVLIFQMMKFTKRILPESLKEFIKNRTA